MLVGHSLKHAMLRVRHGGTVGFALAAACMFLLSAAAGSSGAVEGENAVAYRILCASHASRAAAVKDARVLRKSGYRAYLKVIRLADKRKQYRVYVGEYGRKDAAEAVGRALRAKKFDAVMVEKLPVQTLPPTAPLMTMSGNNREGTQRSGDGTVAGSPGPSQVLGKRTSRGDAALEAIRAKDPAADADLGPAEEKGGTSDTLQQRESVPGAVPGSTAAATQEAAPSSPTQSEALPAEHMSPPAGNAVYDGALRDFHAGRYEKALSAFAEASHVPRHREPAARRMADCCYFLGLAGDKRMLLAAVEQYKDILKHYTDPWPENDLVRLRLGDAYEALQFYYEALGAYDGIVNRSPQSAYVQEATWKGGEMQRRTGRYRQAVERYFVYIMKLPGGQFAKQASFAIGDCYYRMKQPVNASLWFEDALKKWDSLEGVPGDIILSLGYHSYQSGQYATAISALSYYASLYPAEPAARTALLIIGRSFLKLHEPLRALSLCGFILERHPATREGIESVLMMAEIGTNHPGLKASAALTGIENFRDPLGALDRVLASHPAGELLEEILLHKGIALWWMSRLPEAFDVLLDGVRYFPAGQWKQEFHRALAAVSRILVEEGYGKNDHLAVADVYFKAASAGLAGTGDTVCLAMIADSLIRTGLDGEAACVVENMEKHCRDDACRTKAAMILVQSERHRGMDMEAESRLGVLVKGDSDAGQASILLAELRGRKGQPEQAAGLYRDYLASLTGKKAPAEVYLGYGRVLQSMGRNEEAAERYTMALDACREDRVRCSTAVLADAYLGLGDCFHRAGDYRNGQVQYRQAHTFAPDEARKAWSLYRLSQGYMKLREEETAEKTLQLMKGTSAGEFWSKLADHSVEDSRWTVKNAMYLSRR
jgi:tetratricopeptide (TPR) repeat protein